MRFDAHKPPCCLLFSGPRHGCWPSGPRRPCPHPEPLSFLSLSQVHNRNLLSLDFDRVTRTEKIYDDHRKFTLRILYDQAGRPSLWSPSSRLNGVNVTYSPGGHIAGIQRGIMSERMEYDQAGRITSRIFADGKMWSYTYLEKVGVCLPPPMALPCRRLIIAALFFMMAPLRYPRCA